jgi:FtsH-binding integral membrane protein
LFAEVSIGGKFRTEEQYKRKKMNDYNTNYDLESQSDVDNLQKSNSFYSTDVTSIKWDAMVNFSGVHKEVQQKLQQVYALLTCTILAGVLGCVTHMYVLRIPLLLSVIGMFGLLFALKLTESKDVFSYVAKRSLGLYLYGFVNGLFVAPLVESVMDIDPKLPLVALVATTVIFACFSGFALLAKRRSYLYIGGSLTSCLSVLLIFGVFGLFFPNSISELVMLYGGLILFVGFVVFDTQLIIEKIHAGYSDIVHLALELFMDFVAIFIRVLIILAKAKKRNNNN